MRYRIFYIVFFTLFTISSCSNFLEEQSQSEIRPSSAKDMEKLLEGEAYPSSTESIVFNTVTDVFTDNAKCNPHPDHSNMFASIRINERPRFAWERDMFGFTSMNNSDVTFWSTCYDRIKGCNIILDYIGGMTGDESKLEHLKGEALVLRGFYYFMLTNFFGMPYNSGNPAINKAVPIKLTSGVTTDFDKLKKRSVGDCYKQIEKDLLEGSRLMEENNSARSTKITRVNYLTGYALLSRMYLYMEDLDNSLKYADLVLDDKSDLLDLKIGDMQYVYSPETPDEVLWAVIESTRSYTYVRREVQYPFTLSDELVNLFSADTDNGIIDVRGLYQSDQSFTSGYIVEGKWNIYTSGVLDKTVRWPSYILKTWNWDQDYYSGGVRTAELYLNRAEINCRRFIESGSVADAQKALDDLNTLRRNRFKAGYVNKEVGDFADAQSLFDFCIRERRRELCGEGNHRWFDLRRLGMPEIKHKYIDNDNIEIMYTLSPKSPQYQLPIPDEVVKRNPSLLE